MFGTGLIPILPTAGFLFYYQSVAKRNIQSLHESVSQMASLMISQKADELDRRLYNMWDTGSDFVTASNLKKTLARNPEFLFMAFVDGEGREIFSAGAAEMKRLFGFLDLSQDPLFRKAAATGRSQLGEFELIYNLPICRLVYPLEGGRYAFAMVNLRDLFVKLEMRKMGETGGVFLADPEGRVFSLLGAAQPVERESLKNFLSGAERSSRELPGTRGNAFIGSFAEVPGFELYALALQDRGEAFRGINLITLLIIFFLLVIYTVFYFSALFLSRRLVTPVGELIAGAGRVARRDFKRPVSESTGITEMSDLIRAFNDMMREADRYEGLHVEEMLEEKRKVELLISLIHDAIILSGPGGELLYANAAALTLIDANAVPRDGLFELAQRHPGDVMELSPAPGVKKYYRVNTQNLSPRTGRHGVFIVLRDITLEAEMQRMKEEFFHAVAHDLRAPLLSMQGYIKLLEKSCAAEGKSAEYVSNIRISSSRLFEMLENILDIARMDSGNLKPRLAPIDAGKLFSEVFNGFKALFDEKGVEFKMASVPPGLLVKGDERLLRRVVENFLSNAFKFTPKGGSVAMGAEAEGGKAVFYVSDTGPGIPGDQREAVFEKYRQLDGQEAERGGFGLGLAIAKKIVELHKGRIWAEPASSGGSRFAFELPV